MVKALLKKIPFVREAAPALRIFLDGFRFRRVRALAWYLADCRRLRAHPNPRFPRFRFAPYLDDRTAVTPLDAVYFFQNTWMAEKLFAIRPARHVDVGSSAMALGMISRLVPVTMVDIRPLPLSLPGLTFVEGSITQLPFPDASISSISSLCVVEHIGLGRYGDEVDSFGTEKAIQELKRVTSPGGDLLISVPVDSTNTIYFNAHRAFTRDSVLGLFDGFELVEERYQYGYELGSRFDANRGFGTGLYHFRKNR